MNLPRYPLASSAFGYQRRIPVENVVQALVFSHVAPGVDELRVPVTLSADPTEGTWRVRWEHGVIGEIPAAEARHYPDLYRVSGSGFQPETIAGIRVPEGSSLAEVHVYLLASELAVPRNNVSDDTSVLPTGEMFMIDTATGDMGAFDLALASPGQWLVGLTDVGGKPVATIDGTVAGTFAADDADKVLAFIHAAQKVNPQGLVAARGFVVDSAIAIDAGVPEGSVDNIPPLLIPDPRPREVLQVLETADGSWLASVVGVAALDPADEVHPTDGARRIASPQMPEAPEPEQPEAPEPEPAPDRPLTQVEMVRARRAKRGPRTGPRHAK